MSIEMIEPIRPVISGPLLLEASQKMAKAMDRLKRATDTSNNVEAYGAFLDLITVETFLSTTSARLYPDRFAVELQ